MKAVYADRWQEIAREEQPPERAAKKRAKAGTPALHLDCHVLLTVIWNQWNPVFCKTLGQAERSLVKELRDVRNNWAHQKNFSGNDAYRALDSMERMLAAVSAEEAGQVGQVQ